MNWFQWLESQECFPVLERAAVRVLQTAPRYGIPRSALPGGEWSEASTRWRGEQIAELANELWVFARDQAAGWDQSTTFPSLRAQGPDRLASFISMRYTARLRDQVRTQRWDPHRALYRRIRQCLHDDETVRTRGERAGSFFTLREGDLPQADLGRLEPSTYREWPWPPEVAMDGAPLSCRDVVRVARFFWMEAVERFGHPCWIPVRELTRYVLCHLDVGAVHRQVSLTQPRSGSNDEPPAQQDVPVRPTQDRDVTQGRLKELAQALTASWTDREKTAFYARHGEEKSLAEVARQLDYSGPSGVRYLLGLLEERIRDFCLLWPGLSPPEVDSTLWGGFVEEVLRACKDACRSRRQ